MHKTVDNDGGVYGEVYEIESPETLYSLDTLEGHPVLYTRLITTIIWDNKTTEAVWAYFINENGTRDVELYGEFFKSPKDFRKKYRERY